MSQGYTKAIPIDNDPTLSGNSAVIAPSQYAVRQYVLANGGGGGTSGNTIYTNDDSLLSDRTVTLATKFLKFAGATYDTEITADGVLVTGILTGGSVPSLYSYTFYNVGSGYSENFFINNEILVGGSGSGSIGLYDSSLANFAVQLIYDGSIRIGAISTTAPTFNLIYGSLYVNTSGVLYYIDTAGVTYNLLTSGTGGGPTTTGLAYWNSSTSTWASSITTSAGLAGVISDETGTGALVFGTSPTITTSLVAGSSSFDLINTTATTVNFAKAATALTMGATSGTLTIQNPTVNFTGTTGAPIALTLSYTGGAANPTLNLFDTSIVKANVLRASTDTTLGSAAGTSTFVFRGQNFGIAGTDPIIATSTSGSVGTAHIFNEDITAARLFNDANTVTIGGIQSVRSFGTNSSPRNNTGSTTLNLMIGPTASANTKTFNIGTGGAAGHIVTLNVGSLNTNIASSISTFYTDLVVNGNLFVNGTNTTINSATLTVDDKNIELGSVVPLTGISGTLVAPNIVTVSSTTGIISGQTLTKVSGTGVFGASAKVASVLSGTQFTTDVAHNTPGAIVFDVGGASNITANGGGITLKGTTDKTLIWVAATPAWTSSENFDLVSGNTYKINAADVLSATTLGAGVLYSSLTKVGALSGGTSGFVKVDSSGNLTSDNSTYVTATSVTAATKTKITYNSNGLVTAGADASLDDLSDVAITTPANKHVVIYDGSTSLFKNRGIVSDDATIGTGNGFTVELGTGGSVGGYSTGNTVNDTDTLLAVIKRILQKQILPTYVQPTLTGAGSQSSSFEAGTLISGSSITRSFIFTQNNAGSVNSITAINVTPASPAVTISNTTCLTGTCAYGTSRTITSLTLPDGNSAYSFSLRVDYNQGPVLNDNFGVPYPTGQIAAGFLTQAYTFTYVGQRYWFKKSYTTDQSSGSINSAFVRAMTQVTSTVVNGQTVTMGVGDRCLIFAYPATLANITKFEQLDANGNVFSDVTSLLTNGTTPWLSAVAVNGANGYTAVNYKVYKLTSVGAYTTATNFKITI